MEATYRTELYNIAR